MAMNLDNLDSEVIFKKKEEEEIKPLATPENATIRFRFQAWTRAMAQGIEGTTDDRKRGTEVFSLKLGKCERRGDFKEWVNQFVRYTTLGQ